jgi:hypothetical protein
VLDGECPRCQEHPRHANTDKLDLAPPIAWRLGDSKHAAACRWIGHLQPVSSALPGFGRPCCGARRSPTSGALPPPGSEDANGVPAPTSRGVLGKARAAANRAFAETVVIEADGHGNGHGPAVAGAAVASEEQEAVGAPSSAALLSGEGPSGEGED